MAGASLAELKALVEKSLVRAGGRGRFELHELIRQYGILYPPSLLAAVLAVATEERKR